MFICRLLVACHGIAVKDYAPLNTAQLPTASVTAFPDQSSSHPSAPSPNFSTAHVLSFRRYRSCDAHPHSHPQNSSASVPNCWYPHRCLPPDRPNSRPRYHSYASDADCLLPHHHAFLLSDSVDSNYCSSYALRPHSSVPACSYALLLPRHRPRVFRRLPCTSLFVHLLCLCPSVRRRGLRARG